MERSGQHRLDLMLDEAYSSSNSVMSSGVRPSGLLDLDSCLPLSRPPKRSTLILGAKDLLETLNLSADVRIIEGNGRAGINLERRFRLKWWTSGDEPFRAALHKAKLLIYRKAHTSLERAKLAEAWEQAERVVISRLWRHHFRRLVRDLRQADSEYLHLLYRIAQQAWTRAARWRAIMLAEAASPFIPLVELLAAGAFPLGCHDDALWVFVWNADVPDTPDLSPSPPRISSSARNNYVFLSAQFRDSKLTARWETAFRKRGWNTLHGPVSEEIAPPEAQLGKLIREARAIVGLIVECDQDFGLPWWMYQELDYAYACGRPAILLSESGATEPGLPLLQEARCSAGGSPDDTNDPEIWRWLQNNAVLF